jgi:hypothetical protein
MNYDNLFGKNMLERLEKSFDPISRIYSDFYNRQYIAESLNVSLRGLDDLQNSMNRAFSGVLNLNYTQDTIRRAMENFSVPLKNLQLSMSSIVNMLNASFNSLNLNLEGTAYVLEDDDIITFEEADEVKDDILVGILIALVVSMLEMGISNAITKKNSNVYTEPNNKSSIILNIPKDASVTIIDESTNYYYKIIYTDTEKDSDKEGYIYKANAIKE